LSVERQVLVFDGEHDPLVPAIRTVALLVDEGLHKKKNVARIDEHCYSRKLVLHGFVGRFEVNGQRLTTGEYLAGYIEVGV
jgi:hypothetical protein